MSLSIYIEQLASILTEMLLNPYVNSVRINIFVILSLPTMNVKYLSTYLDLLFLLLVFYSFSHTDHVSILIDLYLNIPLFGAIVNGIVSLIPNSNYSLLVYKKAFAFLS